MRRSRGEDAEDASQSDQGSPPPSVSGDDESDSDARSWSEEIAEEEEILLISSRKDPLVWILPAGTVEEGESTMAAALREVNEEAGVECSLVGDCAIGAYADDARLVLTSIFVMRVETDLGAWEDMDAGRQRKWWKVADAEGLLKPRDRAPLRAYIERNRQLSCGEAKEAS